MSVLRAVENRVSLVRCANTGISFVVDPWGRVFHETSLFARESFVATVPLGSGSFAARHPDWEIRWLTVALLLAVLWGGAQKLGSRKRPGKDPANEE
jgi:apolipoprotein N-acyltransferase